MSNSVGKPLTLPCEEGPAALVVWERMKIGDSIRKLRLQKDLTIQQLSELTGLSQSLISQVERDLVSPSVVSLWKIAQALGVPAGYFFEASSTGNMVVRKNQRKKLLLPSFNAAYELLSPDTSRNMEFLMITLDPGETNTTDGLLTHKGEECGVVISGTMQVQLGDETYVLEEGDSIYFKSTIPHRFKNVGDKPVMAVWVDFPPMF